MRRAKIGVFGRFNRLSRRLDRLGLWRGAGLDLSGRRSGFQAGGEGLAADHAGQQEANNKSPEHAAAQFERTHAIHPPIAFFLSSV